MELNKHNYMKNILLVLLFLGINCHAQELSIDPNTGQIVAPINSYAVSGLDSTFVTRIAFDIGTISGYVVPVTWHLQYQYIRDNASVYWYDDKSGSFSLPIVGDATIDESKLGIALYAQQHAVLNNRKVKFTYK